VFFLGFKNGTGKRHLRGLYEKDSKETRGDDKLVLREWYETMNANDCLTGHDTWNQLIEYVKHSACTEFIIHSTCSSTGQAFRFTETGNFSQMYGSGTAGHDMTIAANDADMRPRILLYGAGDIKLDSGDDVFFLENGAERFKFRDGKSIDFLGDRAIHIDGDETYIGHDAGDNITTAIFNTLVGNNTGNDITDGSYNNFFGAYAGALVTTGDYNTLVGGLAGGATAVDIDKCVFVGYGAGQTNTQDNIVAVGYQALNNNTGAQNTAVGYQALDAACTGANNTAMGYEAGGANLGGFYNAFFGSWAGKGVTTGHSNNFFGYNSGGGVIAGNANVAVGQSAQKNNDVSNVVAIGYNAGNNNTGNSCVLIGYDTGLNNAANNRLYINNSNSAFPLIYGEFDNDFVKFGNNNDAFFLEFTHGGGEALITTSQWLRLTCGTGQKINFYEGAGKFIQFYEDGTNDVIEGTTVNNDLFLISNGTGLVKWGTEVVNAGSDRGKLIAMKTAAGTTVYLKTYDTV